MVSGASVTKYMLRYSVTSCQEVQENSSPPSGKRGGKWAKAVSPLSQSAPSADGPQATGEHSTRASPRAGSWSVPPGPPPQQSCQEERPKEASPELGDEESQQQRSRMVPAGAPHPKRYWAPHTCPPLKCSLECTLKTGMQLEKARIKSVILKLGFVVEGCVG